MQSEIAEAITDVTDNLNKLKTEQLKMFDDAIFLITGAMLALFDLRDNLKSLSATEKDQFETFVKQVTDEMRECKSKKAGSKEQKFVIKQLEQDLKRLKNTSLDTHTNYSVKMETTKFKHTYDLRKRPSSRGPSSHQRSKSSKKLNGTPWKKITYNYQFLDHTVILFI